MQYIKWISSKALSNAQSYKGYQYDVSTNKNHYPKLTNTTLPKILIGKNMNIDLESILPYQSEVQSSVKNSIPGIIRSWKRGSNKIFSLYCEGLVCIHFYCGKSRGDVGSWRIYLMNLVEGCLAGYMEYHVISRACRKIKMELRRWFLMNSSALGLNSSKGSASDKTKTTINEEGYLYCVTYHGIRITWENKRRE